MLLHLSACRKADASLFNTRHCSYCIYVTAVMHVLRLHYEVQQQQDTSTPVRHLFSQFINKVFHTNLCAMQEGDWLCKQCSRLLVTAASVIVDQADGTATHGQSTDGNSSSSSGVSPEKPLLVKPQRWMGSSMSAAVTTLESSLNCPK